MRRSRRHRGSRAWILTATLIAAGPAAAQQEERGSAAAAVAERMHSVARDTGSLRISNLVSGILCRSDEATGRTTEEIDIHAAADICPATKVPVRGRGRCVYAGEEKACTWFGFAFDYENRDPATPIVCIWTRSRPANEGDTEEVRKRMATTDTATLDLGTRTRGHYRHPMYHVYEPVDFPWLVVDMDITCRYRGSVVLETGWDLIFSSAFR